MNSDTLRYQKHSFYCCEPDVSIKLAWGFIF